MRRWSFATVLLVVVMALGIVPTYAPASARGGEPDDTTRLASLTLRPTRTELTGGELAAVVVTARLVDPDGVRPRGGTIIDAGWQCPCVVLTNSRRADLQALALRVVSLRRVAGTPQDGIWRGVTALGAVDNGRWTAVAILAGDLELPDQPFDHSLPLESLLSTKPSFLLVGRDWVRLSLMVAGPLGPSSSRFTLSGAARTLKGRPVAGLRLVVRDTFCGAPSDISSSRVRGVVRTDVRGQWRLVVRGLADQVCVRYGEHGDTGQVPNEESAARGRGVRATLSADARVVSFGTAITLRVVSWPATAPTRLEIEERRGTGTITGVRRVVHARSGVDRWRIVPPRGLSFYSARVYRPGSRIFAGTGTVAVLAR